jgi:hypothetical protein
LVAVVAALAARQKTALNGLCGKAFDFLHPFFDLGISPLFLTGQQQ